ncbi:MAG: hypothetical protein EOP45_22670 [Sphingobacteriaceae bacterium]|nr:MAG: hypothetical protein EOP45_22670 [Sphingobacteriaceae bacterium]
MTLNFYTEGNLIKIEWYIDQYYGVISLKKTLIDLGGQCVDYDGNITASYPDSWKQLRKWADYKWYNRPRK